MSVLDRTARAEPADRSRFSGIFTRSLIGGLVTALLVLLAGGWYVLERPTRWSATSSFVVFPASGDPGSEASYYETLSRGQIVSTIAQIVGQQESAGDDVVVLVVPETSVITLTATTDSAAASERRAAAQLTSALAAVRTLGLPFDARIVSTGAGTASTAEASTTTLVGVIVFVAVVLGLLVREALAALARRRGRAAGLG